MDGGAGWQSTVLSNTIVVAATASQPDLIWRGWADKQQRRCVVGTAWAFEKEKRHGKKRNQNPSSSSQCRGGRELQTEDCIIEVGGGGCGGGGHGAWGIKKAQVVSVPQEVQSGAPGEIFFVNVQVRNDLQWTWK